MTDHDAPTDSTTAPWTVPLDGSTPPDPAAMGGKGASLAALAGMGDIDVPAGFAVTTAAFEATLATLPAVRDLLVRLDDLGDDARPEVAHAVSAELRAILRAATLPRALIADLAANLATLPTTAELAVRSSAVGEDAAHASFAGQYDSSLGVRGAAGVQQAIRATWASLFSDRAVAYRRQRGLRQVDARMAVVVQRMLAPSASGVLFTADPLSGHRGTVVVEAVAGLGDALVAGAVTPERSRIVGDAVVERGGDLLGDDDLAALGRLGRRIAARTGAPQDVEWCLVDGAPWIVQSRPITGLYPLPDGADDGAPHVYVSVGHGQMMTDAMTPLGRSVYQLTALPPMLEAGGRLFVDVAARLSSPARDATVQALGDGDPLIGDALRTLLERDGFLPAPPAIPAPPAVPPAAPLAPLPNDPAIVAELIARREAERAELARALDVARGAVVFDVIRADLQVLKRGLVDPTAHAAVMAGIDASAWLNRQLEAWLGMRRAADVLTRSVDGNIVSEMGLALLDVADVMRPHPAVVAVLEQAGDDVAEQLRTVPGGHEAAGALEAFLDRFGVRGAGEIDIARPRWRERPSLLLPVLLAHVHHAAPGESAERFARGKREAQAMEQDVLRRLHALPDGASKAEQTAAAIARLRTFIGYREYPKYDIVARSFLAKQALLREVRELVDGGVMASVCDAAFLRFEELEAAVRDRVVDHELVARRRADFAIDASRQPPRVLTSEGEMLSGRYRHAAPPAGALPGVAASVGQVEGRARVLFDLAADQLAPGDILVTRGTDPSWSAAFVTVAAVVTEVGGVMTHGAVVAREYGVPAVVGVERATTLIPDGARVRVDGTSGYVELLDGP